MSGIRIAHINDWAFGFGECPECGRRFIGLTAKQNLSPHKKRLPAGEKCACRTPINPVVYLSAQQKMHPTLGKSSASDSESPPAQSGQSKPFLSMRNSSISAVSNGEDDDASVRAPHRI